MLLNLNIVLISYPLPQQTFKIFNVDYVNFF